MYNWDAFYIGGSKGIAHSHAKEVLHRYYSLHQVLILFGKVYSLIYYRKKLSTTFNKAYLYGEQNILISANQMLVQGGEIQMGDYHLTQITNKALTHSLNTKQSGLNTQNQRNRTFKIVHFVDVFSQEGYDFYFFPWELIFQKCVCHTWGYPIGVSRL